MNRKIKRDYYAGGLMVLLGAGAALKASSYPIGTLAQTGPGAFPLVLGIALAVVGILIAGTALASPDSGERVLPANPQWFGWSCIVAGPILFIVLGTFGGMIPAIFACVFVCALGDKTATPKSSLVLATAVTVFGALLFHVVLQVQFPLLQWGAP